MHADSPAGRPVNGAVDPRPVRAIWAIAVATTVFHVATASGYGYFRDELYYLVNGRNLGFGFVDHPPLIGLVAWLVEHLLGTSVVAIRLVPAFAAGLTVWLGGAMAATLGAGRFGQTVAALTVLVVPIYLGLFSIFSMNALDVLFWAAAWWTFLRILRTGDQRLWILLGAIAGVGLMNKIGVLFLGFGIGTSLVLTRRTQDLRSPWLWAGGAIAAVLFAPYVGWQIAHGWPTLEFMRNAQENKNVAYSAAEFLLAQGRDVLGPFVAVVALTGLGALLLASRGAFRAAGVAFLVVLAAMIVAGDAKPYYMGASYSVLLAAGGTMLESWTRGPIVRAAVVAVLLVSGALIAPLARPLLPVDTYVAYASALGIAPRTDERHELSRLPQFFADMHGWPELASTVTAVYRQLPPAEQRAACVFAENYGQAGAVEVLGAVPRVISGHNQYYLWGPRGCSETIIILSSHREHLAELFESVTLAATHECRDCMPYENHKPVWIARGLRVPLAQHWPNVKHFD